MNLVKILRHLATACVLSGCASLAVAEAVTTVIDSGPSTNRVDVVFLGDGYQDHQLNDYARAVDGMISHLFEEGEEPFQRYRNYFNVHRIDVVSPESGADVPQQGIVADTALGASYRYDGFSDRVLYISEALADQAVTAALGASDVRMDLGLIAVNSSVLGGGASKYAVFAAEQASAFEVGLHELGHSFSDLTDEYVSPGNTRFLGTEPRHANITIDPTGTKWQPWLGYEQEDIGTIGVFEGGHYFAEGIYRPAIDSKMRTLGRPFDAVSREQIILDIYEHVDPLDRWRDNSTAITDSEPLWAEPIDEQLIELEWSVGSKPIQGATGKQLDFTQIGLLPGTHFVGVRASDSTDWVRRDLEQLQQQVFWVVGYYPGDFDNNQHVGVEDMDALSAAILAGSLDPTFDLDGDGFVSGADRDRWLQDAGSFYGDADIDGQVGFGDFLALSAHFGTAALSWGEGNFDLEAGVGFSDFLLLSSNYGRERDQGVSTFAVPAPATGSLAVICISLAGLHCRRRRHQRLRRLIMEPLPATSNSGSLR